MSSATDPHSPPRAPRWEKPSEGDEGRFLLSGDWTADNGPAAESAVAGLMSACTPFRNVVFDLSAVGRLDTAGAWLLDRTRHDLAAAARTVVFAGAREEHRLLIEEVDHYDVATPRATAVGRYADGLVALGGAVAELFRTGLGGLGFLGEFMLALVRLAGRPTRFRGTALVYQLDRVALRGVPIITLISFLVGGIIAQQGIFQLEKFGAATFVVDLVGILTLRELGVLLTAIMVAGRSGSSITAEIGSMKMREEIDAIRVMGLDPMEVLIVPRVLALIIALPMLTFLSDIAALVGGGLVARLYGDMSPDVLLSRLKEAIALNTFLVGLIKAPFMAFIIGLIAAVEGFAVRGSAESLGQHVTSSVVKAIFMVIVADGLFAIFFAAIAY